MTSYRFFLIFVLAGWPLLIGALLYLMSHLETFVSRVSAETPQAAGLEPVAGSAPDREVKIVFGDKVIGEPE